MKKIWFLIVVWIAIILSWCNSDDNILADTHDTVNINETKVIETQSNDNYDLTKKPSIKEMENFDAIVNGYVKDWTMDYTIPEGKLKYIDDDCTEVVVNWWGTHTEYSNTFKKSQIKEWKTITLKWTYKFDDSKLKITDDEKTVLSEKWWNIIPWDRYENFYKLDYSESRAEDEAYGGSEEWIRLYGKIWWSRTKYERYPANTVLITNDLLLHSFHKLFDNTLKYYEKTIARNIIKDLSNKLFEKFVDLAKNETDSDLKDTYEFLAAYWSVPAILLLDWKDFNVKSYDESNGWSLLFAYRSSWSWPTNDDTKIKEVVVKNEKKYLDKLSSLYKEKIPSIIEKILSANTLDDFDPFLHSYSPAFIEKKGIKQDYTQFMPRSHYTDNAELKTYFMAMKWLMREKFYFGDKNLTNAALIMINNITDENIQSLWDLSAKIKKLIGWDDDLTLESLIKWMKENSVNSIEKIRKLTKNQREELFLLVPQKIQSSAIETDTQNEWKLSANDAKDMTAWFVFFGEKFTLDSYLFDLVTAGEAEEEFEVMPKKQTALIVPDVLEWNWDAAQIVDLWLKEWIEKEKRFKDKQHILEDPKHTQYSSYNKVKQEAKERIDREISGSTVMDSVYHKWLKMLWLLINEVGENSPYFKLDPVYKLKNLLTYMWSYTELKHDTLLYVKQAYAFDKSYGGIDGRFWKNCDIYVDPPSLPTPKWYIEADLDIIDNLIELSNEVSLDFGELWEEVELQFSWFNGFLIHTKNILEKQMDNEKISDEDFEWMRLAYDELSDIVYPYWKDVSQKEMRAALIADIFTSEYKWDVDPLYEAVGRPALLLVMINDINGKRVVIWPVFTHYEFYDSDKIIDSKWSRLNDLQRQSAYDGLIWDRLESASSILSRKLYEWLKSE